MERLQALREVMRRENLGAFIFPTTDPHQSEYTAAHWKGREWISGFDGSAGTAVVTMTGAALWTDSRYFIAAEQQLAGTEFQLMRMKMPDTPTIAEWIGQELSRSNSTEVGIDGTLWAEADVRRLTAELRHAGGLTLRTNLDPLRTIWRDRPPLPLNPVEIWPMEYAGEAAHDKICRIRQALRREHADGMLMTALDDIAWTLNLRGTDVHCTPVFVSFLLIASDSATLFVDARKLTPEVNEYLRQEGVAVEAYDHVGAGLKAYFEYNILLDPAEVSHQLFHAVRREVVEAESPVKRMKAVKNVAEQAGLRRAMLRDGIALVKLLKWLEEAGFSGDNGKGASAGDAAHAAPALTELTVSDRLAQLRGEHELYRGLSFDTIAAYEAHGAIVHYEPTPDSDIPLRPKGMLLLDCGAQYLDGTTDVTRTIALGPLTEEQRQVYTLVLKGHIQLELARFPKGTTGTQLDALARQPLWRAGLNYLHGTGHGVGAYLCVHEGPHQIRMEWKPTPLCDGMTVTDEPGIYLAGRFGVRIENTLLTVACSDGDLTPTAVVEADSSAFLRFEPLTLCPIDKTPIIADMLSQEERAWLNAYHQTVFSRLSPYLNEDEATWLRQATSPL